MIFWVRAQDGRLRAGVEGICAALVNCGVGCVRFRQIDGAKRVAKAVTGGESPAFSPREQTPGLVRQAGLPLIGR